MNKKHKDNIYAFHNAAVLSFLLHEPDAAFKTMNLLLETVFDATLLKTMAYVIVNSNIML